MNAVQDNNKYDIKKMCLACLKNETVLHSIYESNLKDLFVNLTNLEVSEHDEFPSNICIRCTIALKISASFREQCIASYETLRNNQTQKVVIASAIADDEVLSINSSDAEFSDLTDFSDVINKNINNNKNEKSVETNGIEFSITTKMEILHSNNQENIFEDKKLNENAEALRVESVRVPDVSSNSTNTSHLEKNEQTQIILEDSDGESFTCDVCSSVFKTSAEVKSHIRALHESKAREYKCITCGYKAPYRSDLQRHSRLHAKDRKFKCDVCPYASKTAKCLKNHQLIHSEECPHVCSVCNKGFKRLSYLVVHMRRHNGERPYKCDVCPYACAVIQQLRQHYRRHTGEKPFICTVCNKGFIRKSDLDIHIRLHIGERPYKCDICPATFISSGKRKQHLKKAHASDKKSSQTL